MNIPSSHPAPALRGMFARAYVAACDDFTKAIAAAQVAGPGDDDAAARRMYANGTRRQAYDALVTAAVELARAEGRCQ